MTAKTKTVTAIKANARKPAVIEAQAPAESFNASGSKYLRNVFTTGQGQVDVYAVLDAFNVTCPARQHAIKKLLCTGIRGKANDMQDLTEAQDAVTRAIQLQTARNSVAK